MKRRLFGCGLVAVVILTLLLWMQVARQTGPVQQITSAKRDNRNIIMKEDKILPTQTNRSFTIPKVKGISNTANKTLPNRTRDGLNVSKEGVMVSGTSATYSRYQVLNNGPIFKGDTINVRIETRDRQNKLRLDGRDYWFTTMSNSKSPAASIAGEVTDYNNGTYRVRFLAAWTGNATIDITLVHPNDAIHFLNNTFMETEEKVFWSAKFVHKRKTEIAVCTIKSSGSLANTCAYSNPTALGLSSFVCSKPTSLPCNTISLMKIDRKRVTKRVYEVLGGRKYLFEDENYNQRINGNIQTLQILDYSTTIPQDNLPLCQPRLPIKSPNGYWLEGKWFPLQCRKFKCWSNKTAIGECLRNKLIIALGDSNGRQWADQLLGLVKGKAQPPGGGLNTHQHESKYNISIDFHFHQNFIGSKWLNFNDAKYEAEWLDNSIAPDCNYIILISTWAHFAQWTRDAFTARVVLIKEAIQRFKRRCPGAPVLIKSPHPREHRGIEGRIYGSDFIYNEFRKIMLKTFENSGAYFVDTWDLNLAYPCKNKVHMPVSLIQQELAMVLAHVCPESLCEE